MLKKSDWWGYFLSGLVAIIFGVVALVFKSAPFEFIAKFFCAFAIIKGAIDIIGAMKSKDAFWRKVGGIVEVIVGVFGFILISNNFLADAGWSAILGVWAIITGVAEILYAFQLRKVMKKHGIFLITGVISILFGMAILGDPLRAGFLPLNFIIGLYSVVWGGALVVLSFRVFGLPEDPENEGSSTESENKGPTRTAASRTATDSSNDD